MTDRFVDFLNPAVDSSGNPLAGAQLFFYSVGTSTKKDTYSDSAKSSANANPLVADSGGRFGDIFMLTDEQYKVILAPSTDTDPPTSPIDTWDNVSPVRGSIVADSPVVSKIANFNVLTTQAGSVFEVDASSGSVNATLPLAADATNGFEITIKKTDSSANAVTIDGNGAETIDGATTQTLSNQYDSMILVCDGTEWHIKAETAPSTALPKDYISPITFVNSSGDTAHDIDIPAHEARDSADGVNIEASAITKQADASWVAGANQGGLSSSLTLSADTTYYIHDIIVGGSADVGFDTSNVAANLITDHSATAFRLIGWFRTDGSANIINDRFMTVTQTGKKWQFEDQATTSGTAIDYDGIPDGDEIARIDLALNGVSLSGTDDLLVQLGDSGGLETGSYVSSSSRAGADTNITTSTSGFVMFCQTAGAVWGGVMTLLNMDGAGLTWTESHSGKQGTGNCIFGGGEKTLSAAVDRMRLTSSGSNTFDAGSIRLFARS